MEIGFSQTSTELMLQLEMTGWQTPDVVRVAEGYRLAVELMSMVFRPSGKHFIDHLVGTASILAWCGQPADIVNAGMLHAIYDFGDFGVARDRRRLVRDRVGPDVEAIIWRYHSLKWSNQIVRDLATGERPISSIDRDLIIMRLANHLEDNLDHGMLYYAGASAWEGRRSAIADELVHIARALGMEDLAQALETSFEDDAHVVIPEVLRSRYRVVSYQPRADTMVRPTVAVRHALSSIKSKLRFARKVVRGS